MKVIGYARLSRATEESTSIVRQRQEIERAVALRGWELVGIETDAGVSATKSRFDRPGLSAVRAAIRTGRADAVLVWRLDRIARSVVDFGTLLDEGIQVVSATEALDTTTSMGRAMAEILQIFAAMEARSIGARVSSSRKHLPTVGRFPGGVCPYGYRSVPHPDGRGRALEPDPVEAAIVRRMADEVLAGATVTAVTNRLNADAIPPRRPVRRLEDGSEIRRGWAPATVQRILRSDAVLGRMRAGGEYKREGKRVVTVQKAEPVRDDQGLPVVFWPPLLSVEEVERLRVLTDWTATPGRSEATREGLRTRSTRLLAGILTCPNCGHALLAKSRASTTGRDVYTCGSSQRARVCPRGVVVECDRADAEVARKFLAAVGHLRVVESRVSVREVAGLAVVQEQIRETTSAMQDPRADMPQLIERLTLLRTERERLEAVPAEPVVTRTETGQTIAEAWLEHDDVWRRRLIASSGADVVLLPAHQRGRWDPERVQVHFSPDYASSIDYFD